MTKKENKELLQSFTQWLSRLNYAKKSIQERSRQLETYLGWKAQNPEASID